MTMFELLRQALPVALALGLVFVAARIAGALAARLGQPSVVAEIAAGMLAGIVLSTWGTVPHHLLIPLKLIGQVGLALFLVGAVHEMRTRFAHDRAAAAGRTVGWVTAGAFFIPLIAGTLLAGWVLLAGDSRLRGTAPTSSFMLLVTVSLAITAVPVLARILADRNMAAAADGRLALAAAVIIDAASWPLLAVAIAIDAGVSGDAARPMAALAIGVTSAVIMRAIMRRPLFGRLCVHLPRAVPLLLGLAAVIGSAGTEHYGLTAIFGAVLVGMVVPPDSPAAPWSDSVRAVARTGRFLVPVYFVVTGMTILNGPPGASTWVALLPAMALATGLAVVGKVGGGYLGARLGGRPHLSALRVGVLVNTRGLTEIVVVQAGYSAGILTAGIYLALIVMALVTTALTVPLLSRIDNAQGRKEPVSGARRAVGAQP